MEPALPFAAWESFYVIVGSSAGGLTGLMFVVITLAADSNLPRTEESLNAFGTPNVIHFVAALLISAVLSAPWHQLRDPAHVIGATALAGVVYVLIVLRRMLKQTGYKPVLEDWVWHQVLPMIAYATLFVGAAGMSHDQTWALFTVGGVALFLLFIGIHNAWDTVTYIAATRQQETRTPPHDGRKAGGIDRGLRFCKAGEKAGVGRPIEVRLQRGQLAQAAHAVFQAMRAAKAL